MKLSLLILSLLFLSAWTWPTDTVTVSDTVTTGSGDCTAVDNPYSCCTGSDTGCVGLGGEDLFDALKTCQDSYAGCIVKLPCASTISRAEVAISDETTTNRAGLGLTTGFPDGLVIQGCGDSSIVASSIPPQRDDVFRHPIRSIFWIKNWDRSGSAGFQPGLTHVAFRDFQCDGQADLQPSFNTDITGWDMPDTEIAHSCLYFNWGFFENVGQYPYVEVKRLYIHDFVTHGITGGDTGTLLLSNNRFDHMGCWHDWKDSMCLGGSGTNWGCAANNLDIYGNAKACCTGVGTGTCHPLLCCTGAGVGTCDEEWGAAVEGEIECGRNSAEPNNYGWDNEPNNVVTQPGVKATAGGFWGVGNGNATAAWNTFSDIVKYAVTFGSNTQPAKIFDASGTDLHRIMHNTADDGSRLMAGTHFTKVWITDNTVLNEGVNGDPQNNTTSIGCSFYGRQLRIERNTITGGVGVGISVNCWPRAGGGLLHAPHFLTVKDNVITSNGYWPEIAHNSQVAGISVYSGATGESCDGGDNGLSMALPGGEISGNTIGPDIYGDNSLIIHYYSGDTSCRAVRFNPLIIEENTVYRAAYFGGASKEIGGAFGLNIQADHNTIGTGGTFIWRSGATGSCGNWTTGGATVVDNSGNSIGDCAP